MKFTQKNPLKPDEGFKIKGFEVEVVFCKSRNNASGFSITLIFDQYKGFSNILTNYLILKNNGKLGGGGKGFHLKDLPDVKFNQAGIIDLYNSNKKFRKVFDEGVEEVLGNFIVRLDSKELDKVSGEADSIDLDEDEDEDITEKDIRKMKTKKALKKVVSDYELDIDVSAYEKDDIKELQEDIIEELFED